MRKAFFVRKAARARSCGPPSRAQVCDSTSDIPSKESCAATVAKIVDGTSPVTPAVVAEEVVEEPTTVAPDAPAEQARARLAWNQSAQCLKKNLVLTTTARVAANAAGDR